MLYSLNTAIKYRQMLSICMNCGENKVSLRHTLKAIWVGNYGCVCGTQNFQFISLNCFSGYSILMVVSM